MSGIDESNVFDDLDVTLAHWSVRGWGGAEYLVTKLGEALDVDTVYTLGDPDGSNPYGDVHFKDATPQIEFSRIRRLQQQAGRLFEYAQWEDIDWRTLGNPDVLVTSGATTRAVITPDDTLHINYCHSTPRWFYDLYHDRKDTIKGLISRPLLRYLRMRDMTIDSRVDHYLTNSPIIERRLWKYYKRDSEVLYPPVELEKYQNKGDHGYFLHLGRLDVEKGVPEIVDAFEGFDERLVMAGGIGNINEKVVDRIKQADNMDYRGFVSESEKRELLACCTAVVFNGRNEDFGIVPIESNASGKPVLARNEGFPSLFVEEGENGYLHDGSPKGIRHSVLAILKQEKLSVDMNLEQFRFETFKSRLATQLTTTYRKSIEL